MNHRAVLGLFLLAVACSDSTGPGTAATVVDFTITPAGAAAEQFSADSGYWFHGPCCQNQRPIGIWFVAPDPGSQNALFGPQFTFADTAFSTSLPVAGRYDFDSQFLHSMGRNGVVTVGLIFRGQQYLADSGVLVISRARPEQLRGSFYLRMYDSGAPTQIIVLEGTFAVKRDPADR